MAALYREQPISEIRKLTYSGLKFWYNFSAHNPKNYPKGT